MKDWTPYAVNRLDGGINTTNAVTNLKSNELEQAVNVIPESRGAVRKIPGFEKYVSTEASGDAVTGLYEFRMKDGTVHKIRIRGAVIERYSSGWVDVTGDCSITAGTNYQWSFADLNDNLYAVNGTDGIIRWDGSGNFEAFTGSNVPTQAKGIFTWQNRIWLFATTEDGTYYPMRVRASNNGTPGTYDANDFFDVDGAYGGKEVVCVFPDYNDYAYLFCNPVGVYYLIWDATATTWSGYLTSKTITRAWGVASGKSVDLIGNIFCFYGSDKRIRGWDHRDLQKARLIELSGKDDAFFDDVVQSRSPHFVGKYIPELRQYWLACTFDRAGLKTYNNYVMAVQLYEDIRVDDPEAEDKFTCWRIKDRRINAISRWEKAAGGYEIITGSDDGYVYRQNETDNADGAAIAGYFKTSLTDAGLPGVEKKWEGMVIYLRALGVHTVSIQVINEKGQELKTKSVSLGSDIAYFDSPTALFDVSLWDGGGVMRSVFSISSWSEMIQTRFANAVADQPFEVLKIIYFYSKVRVLPLGKDQLVDNN